MGGGEGHGGADAWDDQDDKDGHDADQDPDLDDSFEIGVDDSMLEWEDLMKHLCNHSNSIAHFYFWDDEDGDSIPCIGL